VVRAQSELAGQLQDEFHNTINNTNNHSSSSSSQQSNQEADGQRSTLPPMMVKGCKSDGNGSTATRVHARLVHLPPTCCKTSLGTMVAEDVGKVFQVSGTVVRTSTVQMYESARTYKCTGNKGCSRTFVVHADMEQRNNNLVPPDRCPLLLQGSERCQGSKLQAVEGGSVHTDYQEIKIQEAASSLAIGHMPRSLLIKLQHDLVDHCQPGDEVVVVGSLLAQWHQQSVLPDVDCQVGMAMSAHSVRVVQEKGSSAWKNTAGNNSVGEQDKFRKEFDAYWKDPANQANPVLARDFICKSICPKLYGMHVIKLALLITLIGGVSSDAYEGKLDSNDPSQCEEDIDYSDDEPEAFQVAASDKPKRPQLVAYYGDEGATKTEKPKKDKAVKTRRRDQSHLLLVGDPGTGSY
jgi:DNA replicative helicase MCM subunit Mcm2 (Cdc46/Mcm family)